MAKSASEAANSSRKALASPGTVSGSVTVRKTRQRELPRLKAMSSTFGSIPARIGFSVRYPMGKKVSVSEKSVLHSP